MGIAWSCSHTFTPGAIYIYTYWHVLGAVSGQPLLMHYFCAALHKKLAINKQGRAPQINQKKIYIYFFKNITGTALSILSVVTPDYQQGETCAGCCLLTSPRVLFVHVC